MPQQVDGYVGQILRVDLSSHKRLKMVVDEVTLRQYLGGTGLGIKILYDELSPEVNWNSPENLLIFATGPLNGTKIGGAGTFSAKTVIGDDVPSFEMVNGDEIQGDFNEITVGVGDTIVAYRTPWTTQQ